MKSCGGVGPPSRHLETPRERLCCSSTRFATVEELCFISFEVCYQIMSSPPPNCCHLRHLLHFWLLPFRHAVTLASSALSLALSTPGKLQDDPCCSLALGSCASLLPWSRPLRYTLAQCFWTEGHFAKSGDVFECHDLWGGWYVLLASCGWKPSMMLNTQRCTRQALVWSKVSGDEMQSPFLDWSIPKLCSTSNLCLKHLTSWLLLSVSRMLPLVSISQKFFDQPLQSVDPILSPTSFLLVNPVVDHYDIFLYDFSCPEKPNLNFNFLPTQCLYPFDYKLMDQNVQFCWLTILIHDCKLLVLLVFVLNSFIYLSILSIILGSRSNNLIHLLRCQTSISVFTLRCFPHCKQTNKQKKTTTKK